MKLTKDEIVRARDASPMERALVLASSGVRSGGLDLNWGDPIPVCRVDGSLVLDPGAESGKIACAVLQVYSGSAEGYTTFITPEAYGALQECGRSTWGASRAPRIPYSWPQEGALHVGQEAD